MSGNNKKLKINIPHNSAGKGPRKSPGTPASSQQDKHPYARGSVIEVRHIVKDHTDDDWWSEESSEDEEENVASEKIDASMDETQQEKVKKVSAVVRLCDVIDRVPHNVDSWRYYVHYRDFNRRMDEWINISRIVSPPSVGNAKVRAMKKQQKKLQQQAQKRQKTADQLQKKKQHASTENIVTGPRNRRKSLAVLEDASGTADRKTRSRRKSSTNDVDESLLGIGGPSGSDDCVTPTRGDTSATNVASNVTGGTKDNNKRPSTSTTVTTTATSAADHLQKLPGDVTTTTVGGHTVATVQAVELDEHEGLDEASLREHEEVTKIKNVGFLELGRHQMETWYFSPLPKELVNGGETPGFLEILYVCEFSLRMFARKSELRRYRQTIQSEQRHPPGNEIYRNGSIAMFEIDGLIEKVYCQNLCYIAKLFLDHKTLYYDVDPFLFYVLCEVDNRGYHPVGYYSKEKYSDVGFNLACILSFPAHQRKGYGRFLIAFSYELTKKEDKVGSPEKPMSDLGQQAYKPYWASTIVDFLLNQCNNENDAALSIMDISKRTSIMSDDIVYSLNQLGILKIINHTYFIAAEQTLLEQLAIKFPIKEPRVDPTKLHWTPFVTDIKRDKFSIRSKKASIPVMGQKG